jgi:3-oxoacyl-[acyl-carrier protein] reductase
MKPGAESDSMAFKDKVAVVTGSSRGIGRSIAENFVRQGARVVLNGRKSPSPALASFMDEIEKQGGETLFIQGDAGDAATAASFVQGALDRWGRIDILVNNAGISPMATIEQISEAEWDRVLGVNLKSAFLCSKAVLPHMKKQGGGVIVNISSGSGKSGGIGAHYAASKAGLNTFTKSLAFEGAPHGIRANAIAPGPIETDMVDSIFSPDRKRFLESIIPLGRLGYSQDIANAVVFLCSDTAGYITGEIMELDGGLQFFKPLSYA